MDKKDIRKMLQERNSPHIKSALKTKSADEASSSNDYAKVVELLNNDIINHAAIVRGLKGEPWAGNSEATNRSLFRKKLKKMTNDDGGEYEFSKETLSDIQKILMNLSSSINHSIGRQGK